ncbi:MAG: hypothetical protein IJD90_03690 [Clostridia bacterium]|nr:hypothetical protein [Clostridia bacterium]MBQ7659870.1 hypothetical protein [Alphaproteobacteria bacterium]
MIGNIAGTLSNIGLGAIQKANVVGEDRDLGKAIAQGLGDWNKFKTRQAYIDQLTSEHPEDAAKIAQDPEAYAKMLQDNANAERDQQYKLDVLGKQFENALALEGVKNQNAMGLARLAAALKGNQTTGMQNIEYLKTLGYSPEEAAALYYGGQNPNFSFPAFGEKGFNKADENMGKNYAEDLESYRSMTSKLPELEATVDKLSRLGQSATYTKAGQALDLARKELGFTPRQSAIDRKEYISIVDNQILPLLRDTFGAQFTEREGNTLRQTLGDVNATPEEKNAVLRSFINQKKKSVESQARKLQSYSNGLATNGTQTLMPNYKDKYGLE